jgi:glucose/mannose-6-phosphate isomerase
MSIISILNRCRLIKPLENIESLPDYLTAKQANTGDYENLSRKYAGKIPVLIASEHLKGALHCIRNQFNETAKNFAVYFDLPELNHHLLEGLAHPPSNTDSLFFTFITSKYYHPEVAKRYPVTIDIIKKQNFRFTEISFSGPSPFFETMELVQTGAFTAYYLSQQNGVDPGVIPWVDYFKKAFSPPT